MVGVAALLLACAFPLSAQGFDHSVWDRVLQEYVNDDGQVDYGKLRANRVEFDQYLAQLAARSPDSDPVAFPSREEQLAYWINAYNAFTIQGVVDNWPTKSVRDLGFLFGFFRKSHYVAGNKRYSLNDIEHDIIRKRFRDPRIHFALVCASVSCPRLQNEAYVPERLHEQLNANAREFMNEQRNVYIDLQRRRITLSKLFDWYEGDFEEYARANNLPGVRANAVLAYVRSYLREAEHSRLDSLIDTRIRYFDYDWSVNDVTAEALKR